MTAMRTAEISGLFTRWLERYSPPAQIRENPRAQQDEVQALLGVILRFAPQAGYAEFVATVLDKAEFQMKTRAWPTKGELGAVCSNVRKEMPKPADLTAEDLSPAAINAKRMQRGEPVAEGWLYGTNACDLIATGQVDEATMTRYRSGAFLAREKLYDRARALAWEAEAKARHESARAARRQRESEPRNVAVPDKRAPYPVEVFG